MFYCVAGGKECDRSTIQSYWQLLALCTEISIALSEAFAHVVGLIYWSSGMVDLLLLLCAHKPFLLLIIIQGCIFRLMCSHPELTEDHVLTSAYVKIFKTVTRNAVNKGAWRKKDCSWPPLNKYAMNMWLSYLRIRAHLSWRTGKHLHVLHVFEGKKIVHDFP